MAKHKKRTDNPIFFIIKGVLLFLAIILLVIISTKIFQYNITIRMHWSSIVFDIIMAYVVMEFISEKIK